MKKPRTLTVTQAIALGVILQFASSAASRAQPQITAEQIAALRPLAPTEIGQFGNFWLLKSPDPEAAWPPLPGVPTDCVSCPIYLIGTNEYLVDNSLVDYQALQAQQEAAVQDATFARALLSSPQPNTPQLGDQIDYVWFQLTGPVGTNGPQMTAYTTNYDGWGPWGIASSTNIGDYDPREYCWTLMDPNTFSYWLDGSTYTFTLPPFDKTMEFYKAFDTVDYAAGQWTPIKYLGCNIPDGDLVTSNDVVMRFDLKGDIYKLLKDPQLAIQAVLVRPSGEYLGCMFEIASNGIVTVTAPATAFATGQNTVWIGFVNEGPQTVDWPPDQPADDSILASMTLPDGSPDFDQVGPYLLSLGIDPPITGDITNNHPHEFLGYLQFEAAPPVEDTIGSP